MRNWIAIVVLIVGAGCIREVEDFNNQLTVRNVVVYGTLNDTDGPHMLTVGRIERLNSSAGNAPVSNLQTVELHDEAGNRWIYLPSGAGTYEIPRGILTPQTGTAYRVVVRDADLGIDVVSQFETMPPRVDIDAVELRVERLEVSNALGQVRDEYLIEATVTSTLPDVPTNLRWEVEHVYSFPEIPVPNCPLCPPPATCYFSERPDFPGGRFYNGFAFPADRVEQTIGRTELDDERFGSRFYFNVYQHSISPRALRYFEEVELIKAQGGLFDVPPGAVLGNLVNQRDDELVLGYFQVGPTDTLRVFATPPDLTPFPLQPVCPLNLSNDPADYPQQCFRCEEIPNASFDRPWYF